MAKVVALGADAAGMAAPLLKAATTSAESVMEILQEVIEELRISMFCIGAASLDELKGPHFLEKKREAEMGFSRQLSLSLASYSLKKSFKAGSAFRWY